MALYPIAIATAVPSDVQQLINIFNGTHDIGNINLAPSLSSPTSGSFTLTAQSGNSLGIGAYNYQFSYLTGQFKSDGITLVPTGETLPSAALSITTSSGNTTVKVTLPTSGFPTSAIAINIYRTSVGGSDYKLIATVKVGSAIYIDNTADASRGAQTPPASNTTGTSFIQGSWIPLTLQNGWSNVVQTFATAQCRKNSFGEVELQGRITGGAVTSGTVIATLPVGYRPVSDKTYIVLCNNTSNDGLGEIRITSGGNITVIYGANTYLSLDSIPPIPTN